MLDRKLLSKILITISSLVFSSFLYAKQWPTSSVTIIDPYSPGGATDFIARVLAEHLTKNLAHSVVVENHGGGGSTIGTSRVARAKPDGHTLLLNNMSLAFSKALYTNLDYDPETDLRPIINIGSMPTLLAVANHVDADNLEELLVLAKSEIGRASCRERVKM